VLVDKARTVGWRWRNICATKVGVFAKEEKEGFGTSVSEEEAMTLKV
jgi:hypothetical protein